VLLAFDLKQPWTCHQNYKILDELHADIFARPEVTADRILAVVDLHSTVVKCMEGLDNGMLAAYRLSQYFILYLLRQALELDNVGKEFCADPGKFLRVDRVKTLQESIGWSYSDFGGQLIKQHYKTVMEHMHSLHPELAIPPELVRVRDLWDASAPLTGPKQFSVRLFRRNRLLPGQRWRRKILSDRNKKRPESLV
jgi:hypothetical protein